MNIYTAYKLNWFPLSITWKKTPKTIQRDLFSVNNYLDAAIEDHVHNSTPFFHPCAEKEWRVTRQWNGDTSDFLGQDLLVGTKVAVLTTHPYLVISTKSPVFAIVGKDFSHFTFFSGSTVEELMFLVSSPCWLRLSPHPRGEHNWQLM